MTSQRGLLFAHSYAREVTDFLIASSHLIEDSGLATILISKQRDDQWAPLLLERLPRLRLHFCSS